jgi:hypothetical protein
MGYRGADSRRQPPWQSSSGAGPEASGSWDEGSGAYGRDEEYGGADGYGGYPRDDSYAGYEDYGRDGGYGATDGYGAGAGGYAPDGGYDAGYDQGAGYDPSGGYGQPGGYADRSGGYEGHPGGGYGSGPYEQQRADAYRDTGGRHALPGRRPDAGNDWYSGQPSAASGSGFADTGMHNFGPQATGSYRSGPGQAVGDLNGYDQGSRDPVRGFPPAPARRRAQLEAAPPQGLAQTGQQERYDDTQYDAYPVYRDQDDYDAPRGYGGQGGYQPSQGYDYDAPQAFDTRGYDTGRDYDSGRGYQAGQDYDNYEDERDPYQERYDGGPGPRPDRGGKTRNGAKRSKRPLVLSAVAIVAIGVLGAAGYTYMHRHKPSAGTTAPPLGPLPTSGTSASAATAQCVKQFGEYCHIELRTDDPAPLTVGELYPPAFLNETDKTSFTRITTRLDKTCANGVIGTDLISALKSDACTQVLRASYVSGDGKIMGTIGVINLATTNDAHHAGKVVGANDFIAPLSTKTGVGSKLGSGTGVVEAEFKGHYLILTWAEFTSGKAPSTTAQDQVLEQFEADLVAGSANIALSERMVNGVPPTAPN